jgi:predicted secreted hydrolase
LAPHTRVLRAFLAPAERPDWPGPVGEIDLALHDLPHASSATEWWYLNTHLVDADDPAAQFSAFAAFFRVLKHTDASSGGRSYAHALNWALSDVGAKKYVQECVLDRDSPASEW